MVALPDRRLLNTPLEYLHSGVRTLHLLRWRHRELPRDILQKILDDATGQSGVHDDLADHVSGFTDPSRSLHRDVLAA